MGFWNTILSLVEKQLSRQAFDTWFRPVLCRAFENGKLSLSVPSESFKKCLLENYATLILEAVLGEDKNAKLSQPAGSAA